MTCLLDLANAPEGAKRMVSATPRQIARRTDRLGRHYARVLLDDGKTTLWVYCWQEHLGELRGLVTGSSLQLRLGVHRTGSRLLPRLLAVHDQGQTSDPKPLDTAYRSRLIALFENYLERCPNRALQAFLKAVFSDPELTRRFLLIPASRGHHHSWPGGLLEHSLEVARLVYQAGRLDSIEERALGSVAGLLHDLGKVHTFEQSGRKSEWGKVLSHSSLTLEMLAGPLRQLDREWPDGAIAMRYLLGGIIQSEPKRPLLPIALLVSSMDRYSAASSARELALETTPNHAHIARLCGPGPISRFWLPRPPAAHAIAELPPKRRNPSRDAV